MVFDNLDCACLLLLVDNAPLVEDHEKERPVAMPNQVQIQIQIQKN